MLQRALLDVVGLRRTRARFILPAHHDPRPLTVCLSLLLVGMQHELLVHELDHLRAKVERGNEAGLHNAASGLCLQCALLASSSDPVPAADKKQDHHQEFPARLALGRESPWATAPPAFYRSRAPPPA